MSQEIPTRSLRAAAHPQARMQQLLKEAQPDNNTSINAETHTEENTENLTSANTETVTEAQSPVKPRAEVKRKAAPAAATAVSRRIVEELHKEPVVRKTIDLPASLNDRLQSYCAANRIKTERRVFLVLLESFLEGEGF